ncbi:MAG TPA: TIGR03364 family FAD-dependent oxidoreductase [Caulobacteraceae bacterium]|jgi:FAD dependent oxidoreductase TIGR03364|nr:TIGR03364 family FAD-dependent oxidoreductase [Caulobacteraceae bacterium]
MAFSGTFGGRPRFDLAVIGAGIVGLGHALAAARQGLRVVVIDRDLRANGASIRNFGFITVSGQARGEVWRFARRARDVWAEIAPRAGVPVEHHGLVLTLRRPESVAVAEAFLATEMGEECELLTAAKLKSRFPQIASDDALGALVSPHELRVDSALALPRLAEWLAREHAVTFRMGETALSVEPPVIATSRGEILADRAVVCPNDDLSTLFPERIEAYELKRCRLSMLRLASPGFRWPAGVMSDLGLVRYRGYADLPSAPALARRLEAEQPRALAHGVHLIAVQNADGTLVVGDSHHYDDLPLPFAPAEAEALILEEFEQATGLAAPPVIARWTGVYPVSEQRAWLVDKPSPQVRLVIVSSGTGASTAFAIGEATIAELCGS